MGFIRPSSLKHFAAFLKVSLVFLPMLAVATKADESQRENSPVPSRSTRLHNPGGDNDRRSGTNQIIINSPNSNQIVANNLIVQANPFLFQPLATNLRATMVAELQKVERANISKILVMYNTNGASPGRAKLVQELVAIFVEAGIRAESGSTTVISADPLPSVKVHFSKSDSTLAEAILRACSPLLNVEAAGYIAENLANGELHITINVDPRFLGDGSVDL